MIWKYKKNELSKKLNTDIVIGLTEKNANKLSVELGLNKLSINKKKSILNIILNHFFQTFNLLLIILALFYIFINQWKEFIIILFIILIDAILVIYHEIKSNNSLNNLNNFMSLKTIVIRNGIKINIDSQKLVVGDLVFLEAGMFVPADLRIIKSYNLKINESILTGEYNLISKNDKEIIKDNLNINERKNIAFMSTFVETGNGLGLVYAIAEDTEIGKISKLLKEKKSTNPILIKKISFLIKIILFFSLFLGLLFFLFQFFIIKKNLINSLIFIISLIISVIPEGLQLIVMIILSLGSLKISKKHAIIKNLLSIEILGKANIICFDKTGTLTQNKIIVKKYYLINNYKNSDNFLYKTKQEKLFLDGLILCNNSQFNKYKFIGDPTESAIINWSENLKFSTKEIFSKNPRIHEIPFDSERKLMSTINKYNKKNYVFVKGAVDNLINNCSHILLNNEILILTSPIKIKILLIMKKMTNLSLRVLGVGYKVINNQKKYNNISEIENNLIFLGLIGMINPPKHGIKKTLIKIKNAGIKSIMITGDHLNTAFAIGKKIGLVKNKNQTINCNDNNKILKYLSSSNINKYQIFARVSPEYKVKIIKLLQKNNQIVSMIGDGVNDAPSLRIANIGIAMGIAGTDIAKDVSQIVLTNDNFNTIIDIIEEGRNIYNKVKKIIIFILITNFAQLFLISFGFFISERELFQPIQILWINLIVESIIAIPMSMGPNNPILMLKKPLKNNKLLIINNYLFIFIFSLFFSFFLLLIFYFLSHIFIKKNNLAFVYIFIIMSNAPIFYSFSIMFGNKKNIFNKNIFKNKYFFIASIIAFILNISVIFMPVISNIFNISNNFHLFDWFICIFLSTIPMWLLEFYKFIIFLFKKKPKKI